MAEMSNSCEPLLTRLVIFGVTVGWRIFNRGGEMGSARRYRNEIDVIWIRCCTVVKRS